MAPLSHAPQEHKPLVLGSQRRRPRAFLSPFLFSVGLRLGGSTSRTVAINMKILATITEPASADQEERARLLALVARPGRSRLPTVFDVRKRTSRPPGASAFLKGPTSVVARRVVGAFASRIRPATRSALGSSPIATWRRSIRGGGPWLCGRPVFSLGTISFSTA